MKKFNKARQRGARMQAQSRWDGARKILQLLARVKHSLEVEPVVNGHYAVDLLVNKYSL
jgi:hypothetical protein